MCFFWNTKEFTRLKKYFMSTLLFTMISFAYVDKYMNYSGIHPINKLFETNYDEIELWDNSSYNFDSDDTLVSTNERTIDSLPIAKGDVCGRLNHGKRESAFFINTTVCVKGVGKNKKLLSTGQRREKEGKN